MVREIIRQLSEYKIPFEVRCYDDASPNKQVIANEGLSEIPQVVYKELASNIGRAQIRNLLAEEARFDRLLFLDCDMSIISENYIQPALDSVSNGTKVVCGGHVYSTNPPSDRDLLLHWKAGSKREVARADVRMKEPFARFTLNNMLIEKELFNQIKLRPSLTKYGHEDSLFGCELKNRNIPVLHIDNPVEHTGLSKSNEYIRKTLEGVENLYQLSITKENVPDIRLYRVYLITKKTGLLPILIPLFRQIYPRLFAQLSAGKSHSLFLLDMLKLVYFSLLNHNIKKE